MVLSPLLRQVLVLTSMQLTAMSVGGAIGYPCVLLQQFQSETSDIKPDLNMSTWIVSSFGMAGIFGIFMPTVMQLRGRRFAFRISCLIITLGCILSFVAKNTATLIISQFFLGLGSNSMIIVNLMTTSEMLSPKYRSVSMMLLGVNQSAGMAVVNVLGNFINWKSLALIISSPAIVALFIVFIWPESPPWLAYKGNFDECKKAFTWLRGTSDEAVRELHALISAQRAAERKIPKLSLRQLLQKFRRKDFYLPNFYMLLIHCNFYLAGAFCLYIYTWQLLEVGTGDETIAFYGSLYRDVSLVAGSCGALGLAKYFKSKSILVCTSALSISCIIACFIVSYMKSVDVLASNSSLLVYTFAAYMTFCNSGYNFITFSLSSELMPVKHRGIGGSLFIIYSCCLNSISTKTYPYLIIYLNLWGTFLLFAVLGTITTLLIYFYIPDTHKKTLQEIEDYYNYGTYVKQNIDDTHVSLNIVETKIC